MSISYAVSMVFRVNNGAYLRDNIARIHSDALNL